MLEALEAVQNLRSMMRRPRPRTSPPCLGAQVLDPSTPRHAYLSGMEYWRQLPDYLSHLIRLFRLDSSGHDFLRVRCSAAFCKSRRRIHSALLTTAHACADS